ncbi:MAG: APC family permease [Chloroflexota bacterium]|jgi:APA family basic amino acid/polyamine antiporter
MGEERRLVRRLGLVQTIAIALGAMIGAGVYVSMAEAAGTTGGSLVLAVLLGAGVATLNGLSSVELGVYDPRAGGAYQFGRSLLAPIVGFAAGWLFLLAALAAAATYALTFGAYIQPLLPGVPARIVGFALILGAITVNLIGVRLSARANGFLVAANLLILVAFVAIALPTFDVNRLQPFLSGGVGGLLQASALLFFAYTGYARPVTIAEEVIDPRSTLPRAVPTAIGAITVLYLGIALAALGVMGPERFGESGAPLRAAMIASGNPIGPLLISVGALIATSTVLLTEIWGLSRLSFAMSRNGDLPGWLSQLSSRERIPRNAVLSIGVLLLVMTATMDLRPLLEASSLALLVYYGVMSASALRLPPNQRLYSPAVPTAGIIASALVAFSLPWQTLLIVFGALIVGLAYYTVRKLLR